VRRSAVKPPDWFGISNAEKRQVWRRTNCSSTARYSTGAATGPRTRQYPALAAYTSGSARLNHADDTGRIEVGSLADLAVLDRDPFAGAPEEIANATVVATYVEGELVFSG
jgi:predicted amidohydrolase YtcJ